MEYKNIAGEIVDVAKSYEYQEPPGILVKLQELLTAVARAVRDFLNMLQLPQTGSSDTRLIGNLLQLLLAVAAVVAVAIVLFLVLRRMKYLRAQKQLTLGEMLAGESVLDSKGWRNLAEELFQKGSSREACRAIYMSCLHLLDESAIAVFAPTKTNYEYFYALKQYPPIAQSFRQLVDNVELIWFGGKIADVSDYDQCLRLLKVLTAETELKVKAKTANNFNSSSGFTGTRT